jgi:hypothetical protein
MLIEEAMASPFEIDTIPGVDESHGKTLERMDD